VAGDAAARPKPSGDGVRLLQDALGCTAGETLVVGDSRLDLEAARDAGAAAALASWHPWAGRSVLPAAIELAAPDDLRPWLGLAPPVAG
jgi:phosphoglycolate phosphatase-like HAD superfamily hydrolase